MNRLTILSRRAFSALACVSVLATVIGCSNSGNGATGPNAATYIYAVDYTSSSSVLRQYPANSTGVVSPSATILPPSGFYARGVATDASGNIYLGGVDANDNATVFKYAKGANGAATPMTTLLGGSNFYDPTSMVFDATGNLYVLDWGLGGESPGVSVSVYTPGASGTATPIRTITDTTDNTLLGFDLAVNAAGNVYVSAVDTTNNTGVVVEYASSANGTVTPTRKITTSGFFYGIAVDSHNNVYVADGTEDGTNGSLVEFGPTASGAATPSMTLSGSATGISFLGGVRLDAQDNLYALNEIPGQPDTYNILTFKAGFTGDATPATVFSSTALVEPSGVIALY
jgi:hypothetical protein